MPASHHGSVRRFFVRLFGWLIAAPFLLLLTLFAVSNRQDVTLQLWPFPVEVILPLSLLLLGLLLGALLLGMLLGWLGQHSARAAARQHRREVSRLQGLIAKAPSITTDGATTTLLGTRPTAAGLVAGDPHFKDSL